jgi:transcriptional regulator with XRE-family HTH domain
MELQRVLKALMKERGLTFRQLSDATGVPMSSLKDWASGAFPRDLDGVRKVAQFCDVSFEYLVFGTEATGPASLESVLNAIPTNTLFSGWVKVSIEAPSRPKNKKRKGGE